MNNGIASIGQAIITFLVGGGFATMFGYLFQYFRERVAKREREREAQEVIKERLRNKPLTRLEKAEVEDRMVETAQRVAVLLREQLEDLEERLLEERSMRERLEREVGVLRKALREAGVALPASD